MLCFLARALGLLLIMAGTVSCAAPQRAAATSAPEPRAGGAIESEPLRQVAAELLAAPAAKKARLTIVFVIDGLRPDAISAEDTPNLFALRTQGVTFPASHSVFPTVTRVNASSIATGRYPAHHGILGNVIYAPEVDPQSAISTGELDKLLALDAASGKRLLFAESLGEVLARSGKKFAVVSSSGNGCALLLNHRAPDGKGVLINGFLEPGKRVAYPQAVNDAVIARFGHTPLRDEVGPGATDWAERVLREYVLPELAPDVILNWITQPDGAQHAHGVKSPEARAAISNDDRNIGLVLEQLKKIGLYEATNILVLSDHGFSANDQIVNLTEELVRAGLKASATSTDVVLASTSIHVKQHDPARIAAIVAYLQQQPWADVIFTRPRPGAPADGSDPLGSLPGTFSLALIHDHQPERGADIVLTFPWSSDENRHGARGVESRDSYGQEKSGPQQGDKSSHGSMSAWDVRNTWFAWGVDFKQRLSSPLPVGNVDLFPTVLALLGLPAGEVDGRAIAEAFVGGPDPDKIPVETRTYLTENEANGYRAAIQVTSLAGRRYIDKSWRVAPSAQ